MRWIFGRLCDARVTGWVSLMPLVFFVAEWLTAASWRGYYTYREDLVGPLGTAFCGPEGNWPCSDLYRGMNVALVLTGLAVAVVGAGFLVQRVTARGHAVLLLAAGLALSATGVITQQVDYTWNLTAVTVFMTLGAVSVLFIALDSTSRMTGERRGVALLAGIGSLVGYFAYLGQHDVFGSGGAQRMAVYGILVAVIALGTAGLRSSSGANAESRQVLEESR